MKYLLTIVLLFSFGQARATEFGTFERGNSLLEYCEKYIKGNYSIGNSCAGYIGGIVDVHRSLSGWGVMSEIFCIYSDYGINTNQLVRVVTEHLQEHLQEHPEDLHALASSVVLTALSEAFPCE